ncbi:leukocyte immunoglobulin-like receptor subfamily B member 3 isoform X1 [Myotis lucifugus]|uniref:leukocyte immunoglobulin-like receptor subfamily B member 3 isoform X1 n=1 Tax=Myotis lucifugus TaxID=59463 RepID=UPI000CCC4CD4|nr:leukocyte immunoglobulin-like receptor subfamily B member 3 isoform X1 [Myotis lucifugus]
MSHEAWTLSHPILLSWEALWSLHIVCTLGTMEGRSMTSTLTALLCLRLCQGLWDQVQAGVGGAPSLSAQPSPVVASGENVSLSCTSNLTSGPFHLLKEGGADLPRHMEAEPRMHAGRWRAIFPLGPVSTSHGGTYRCYGSSSSYSNVWSPPSDPLELVVSGLKWYLIVLIGVSVALVLLLSLFFLLLRHQRRQSKGRTSDAVAKDTQPERDRKLDSQAAAPEDPQDVTYAQLKPLTLSQESSAPPSSPSEEPREEPSLYASLAMH